MKPRLLHRLAFATLLLISAAAVVAAGRRSGPKERDAVDRLEPAPLAHWSPRAVDLITLGHRGLYDDFSAIWAMQVLVDSDLKKSHTPEQIYASIEPSLRQTPKIESFYLLSCFVLSLELNEPRYCETISLLGLKAFPNSWRIPMTQGFIASFKTGNKAQAAAFYGLASTRPQSPPWVQGLAARLAGSPEATLDDLNQAIELLKEVPGGTRLLETLRPTFKENIPAPVVPKETPQEPETNL